ncbi:MAG TPA: hypothetical protein VMY43_12875 [Methanothrix sp.]|nr:hypothetical protein [Methanothrix sp.]
MSITKRSITETLGETGGPGAVPDLPTFIFSALKSDRSLYLRERDRKGACGPVV